MRCLIPLFLATLALAQTSITTKTAGMQKMPGYFPLYYDAKSGKLFLEIDKWNTEILYIHSLPAGVGSNDVGLDRGQIGGVEIVKFERSGPKVLLIQPNYRFRAISHNPDERAAVEQAFAQSVLFGFTVEAEEGNRALVDATAFYLRDAHHIPETLQRTKQGSYKLDASRSALYLERTRNFPRNTEVEATLTFAGDSPGRYMHEVTPSPDSVTVREHHSFVQLPDAGYQPREFDPRAGYFGIQYMDFAAPIDEPVTKRYIARHRLRKKDPSAAVSEAVEPIVYYLDRGTPEPIRSALLEGASWWDQAFAAAGYKDAFRVEMLPAGADPMDVRYNLIQWVHRSSRGWSYGGGVTDPRTGEIIKGQVTLGSLRVRQDYLIAEGLIAAYDEGKPIDPRMEQMALARLRQLSAHELGHTLGLSHNFAASAHDRASVMDYPPPAVKLAENGDIDLTDAYATGIGEWDKVTIAYGYQDFPPGADSKKALDEILRQASARGLIFISDSDSRAAGGAHPTSHLWDTGTNAVDELNRIMKLRRRALDGFSEKKIRPGVPMSSLEEVLVPVYMYHRYQTEAAAKVLGGLDYTYALRGDGQKIAEIVPAAEQRRAMDALLATLDAHALALPERLLRLIPPRAHGFDRTREDFRVRTGITFDAMSGPEAAADLTVGLMLNPERAARLVQYHARNEQNPGLSEVIEKLIGVTWKAARPDAWNAETGRTIDNVVLYHLMALAADPAAAEQARAIAFAKLDDLRKWLVRQTVADESQRAHLLFAAQQIRKFQDDPKQVNVTKPVEPPDGPPI